MSMNDPYRQPFQLPDGTWSHLPPPPGPPRRSWPARHKVLSVLLVLFGLLVVLGEIGAALGGADPEPARSAPIVAPATITSTAVGVQETTPPPPPPPPAKPKSKPAAPVLTKSQEQAIGTAKDYLGYSHFSRTGLIGQLVFEHYSKADATFAVDYLKVDYNTQAAGTAKDYLETTHFSRGGLIEQLMFEGYTRAQATYAADKVGL